MARKKTYTSPPRYPENQWLRDALAHAHDAGGRDWSYDEIAAEMMKAKVGGTYDKSTVQKMTTIRRIKLPEAAFLSDLLGYPGPAAADDVPEPQLVKLVSWVSAGQISPQDAITDLEEFPSIDVGSLPPGSWIALRVSGTSMNKLSPPESIIVVNLADQRLVSGKCYVIEDEFGVSYKAYDHKADPPFQPRSYIETPPPKLLGDVRVIGRVYRTMLDL